MDGFRLGNGSYFVIEGDEYDSAFFDKGAKFFHYRPYHLILTSIEYDHADIYPDEESYLLSFSRLLRFIPKKGLLIACKDSSNIRKLLKQYKTSQLQYYSNRQYKYGRHNLSYIQNDASLAFCFNSQHNQANAIAASLMALRLEVSCQQVRDAIESFVGVKRRMEVRWQTPSANLETIAAQKQSAVILRSKPTSHSIVFIEDFAHHPSAVHASISTARKRYADHFIHVLFEPRSASSHRKTFQEYYYHSFEQANSVWLCELFRRDKVKKMERLNVRQLQKDIQRIIKNNTSTDSYLQEVHYAPTAEALYTRFSKKIS